MSKGEATISLWKEENGRPIFHATMSRAIPHDIMCDPLQQPWHQTGWREKDKLQAEICGINGLFYPVPHTVSHSTHPTSLPSMAWKYGQPVVQNPPFLWICKYALESYLEAHLRRIRGGTWCWRWVNCKVIISRVTISSHPTTLELIIKRESWPCWELSAEKSQNFPVNSEDAGQTSAFLNICFHWESNRHFILPKDKQECSYIEYSAQRCISEHLKRQEAINDPGL